MDSNLWVQTCGLLISFPNVANHFFIDPSSRRNMSIKLFGKSHVEKLAVVARCNAANCQFNGIVLISKKKTSDVSLRDEKCPLCHNFGQLELVLYN